MECSSALLFHSDYPLYKSHSFEDCRVEVRQVSPKNVKPHVFIIDSQRKLVLEVPAKAVKLYRILIELDGREISSFLWKKDYDPKLNETRFQVSFTVRARIKRNCDIERIFLDVETTGLDDKKDEILQLAIIDGDGKILWNRLYKPSYKRRWPDAQAVHHISPATVHDCPRISEDLDGIQEILDRAQKIYAFNSPFDFGFLRRLGLSIDANRSFDTMRLYGRKYHGRNYIKLSVAAKECGYSYKAHDALADCRATRHVQDRVDGHLHKTYLSRTHPSSRTETERSVEAAEKATPCERKPREEVYASFVHPMPADCYSYQLPTIEARVGIWNASFADETLDHYADHVKGILHWLDGDRPRELLDTYALLGRYQINEEMLYVAWQRAVESIRNNTEAAKAVEEFRTIGRYQCWLYSVYEFSTPYKNTNCLYPIRAYWPRMESVDNAFLLAGARKAIWFETDVVVPEVQWIICVQIVELGKKCDRERNWTKMSFGRPYRFSRMHRSAHSDSQIPNGMGYAPVICTRTRKPASFEDGKNQQKFLLDMLKKSSFVVCDNPPDIDLTLMIHLNGYLEERLKDNIKLVSLSHYQRLLQYCNEMNDNEVIRQYYREDLKNITPASLASQLNVDMIADHLRRDSSRHMRPPLADTDIRGKRFNISKLYSFFSDIYI